MSARTSAGPACPPLATPAGSSDTSGLGKSPPGAVFVREFTVANDRTLALAQLYRLARRFGSEDRRRTLAAISGVKSATGGVPSSVLDWRSEGDSNRGYGCLATTQCRSNPVSGRSLLKTGIFEILAGDYWQFRARIGQMRSPETSCQFVKARCRRAFLGLLRAKSPGARLAGWRRSRIRTSLHANSLLTGNFTGNCVVSGLRKRISQQKPFAPQRHLDQFPTQINREDFSKNRDFSNPNREKQLRAKAPCPRLLFPRKETFADTTAMSASCR